MSEHYVNKLDLEDWALKRDWLIFRTKTYKDGSRSTIYLVPSGKIVKVIFNEKDEITDLRRS